MNEQKLAEQLVQAAKIVEEQLDQQLEQLSSLDSDDIEEIRRKRIAEMRKAQQQKQNLLSNGHGKYEELNDEREFFDAAKKSSKFVCHFYDAAVFRCKVVDQCLEKLATKHLNTRFVKVNAEKVQFLIKRLNIRIIPTIGISLESKMTDYIRVFEGLGQTDEIKVEDLEKRLASCGAIELPKLVKTKNSLKTIPKQQKSIRSNAKDDDSGDDW